MGAPRTTAERGEGLRLTGLRVTSAFRVPAPPSRSARAGDPPPLRCLQSLGVRGVAWGRLVAGVRGREGLSGRRGTHLQQHGQQEAQVHLVDAHLAHRLERLLHLHGELRARPVRCPHRGVAPLPRRPAPAGTRPRAGARKGRAGRAGRRGPERGAGTPAPALPVTAPSGGIGACAAQSERKRKWLARGSRSDGQTLERQPRLINPWPLLGDRGRDSCRATWKAAWWQRYLSFCTNQFNVGGGEGRPRPSGKSAVQHFFPVLYWSGRR